MRVLKEGTEKVLPAPLPRLDATYSSLSASVLREMVMSGQLKIGERINEVETANALGISRAPLREAIQTLLREGLLVSIPNRGAFVRTYSEDELEDLYELRLAFELHALSLVARRASPEQLKNLDTLLDETDSQMHQGATPAYPEKLDFHVRMLQLSQSRELLDGWKSVQQRIALARSRSGHEPARADHAFHQHREVVQHLRDSDVAGAARLLEKHVRESLANALMIVRQESEHE
jgi:DNA-binding GntR family transcriptional regulator